MSLETTDHRGRSAAGAPLPPGEHPPLPERTPVDGPVPRLLPAPSVLAVPPIDPCAALGRGSFLAGYELLEPLGGGGLTRVFRARESSTGELRVAKILRPEWAEHPTAVSLIQREARAGMSVRHPHLVAVLDAHVSGPPYFVVMELLAGESVAARLRRCERFGPGLALWVARQVAQGLGALYARGFIHGDIKPSNIFFSRDGQAKLIDLGFAHRVGENSDLRERGYVVGTVNYMAPEVLSLVAQADIRSDLYSLGVSLYEMLTGDLPYPRGDVRETIQRSRLELPRDPRLLLPTLPDGICGLLDQLLSKNPIRRPPTPADLVARLVALETEELARRRSA